MPALDAVLSVLDRLLDGTDAAHASSIRVDALAEGEQDLAQQACTSARSVRCSAD
jgi:hypothetical protein